MRKQYGIAAFILLIVIGLAALSLHKKDVPPISSEASSSLQPAPVDTKSGTATREKNRRTLSPFDIQGVRLGMTPGEVKQQLRKRNMEAYKTSFPDLFIYHPAPGTEVKLLFTCSAAGSVLNRAEFSTEFTAEEANSVLPNLRQKLIAKYGEPSEQGAVQDGLELCWGNCGQDGHAASVHASTTSRGTRRSMLLLLTDNGMRQMCEDMRHEKINRWLYRWIAEISRFRTGMTLKDASILYEKRYQEKFVPEEEREEPAVHGAVTNYVVREKDFFDGLDYEWFAFEGERPGLLTLKFTGDQAGRNSPLNNRLTEVSCSTTKFSNSHSYSDVRQKLDKFKKIYGKPQEERKLEDGVSAFWQREAKKIAVSIFDSGLITVESRDPSLNEAYRSAATIQTEEFSKTRFDKEIF